MKVHVMMMSKYDGREWVNELIDVDGDLRPLDDDIIRQVLASLKNDEMSDEEKNLPLSELCGTEYDVSDYQRHYEGEESSLYFMAVR